MKEKKLTTRQLVAKYIFGDFNDPSVDVQCDAGWYDWFCRNERLANKTHYLYKRAIQVLKADAGKRINQDTTYIWFKNSCPVQGRLYDDLRFADLTTGDVLYTIVPHSGFTIHNNKAQLYGRENDFEGPLVEGTWKDIINYFKAPKK